MVLLEHENFSQVKVELNLTREQDPGNAIPWTWSRPSGARSISDLDAQLARMEFPSKEALVRRGRPFSVDVEGIVGTGKSTCLNFFRVIYKKK